MSLSLSWIMAVRCCCSGWGLCPIRRETCVSLSLFLCVCVCKHRVWGYGCNLPAHSLMPHCLLSRARNAGRAAMISANTEHMYSQLMFSALTESLLWRPWFKWQSQVANNCFSSIATAFEFRSLFCFQSKRIYLTFHFREVKGHDPNQLVCLWVCVHLCRGWKINLIVFNGIAHNGGPLSKALLPSHH